MCGFYFSIAAFDGLQDDSGSGEETAGPQGAEAEIVTASDELGLAEGQASLAEPPLIFMTIQNKESDEQARARMPFEEQRNDQEAVW